MRSGSRLILVLAIATAAGFGDLRAEDLSPLDPPDTARYLKWGPLWARPGITIPNLGYDSNVFYRTDTSSDPPVGDYFIDVSPSLQGLVLFGRHGFLTFDERLEFYLYASEHELNYYNQLGRMRLTIPFRRVGLYGDFGYDRVQDRPIDAQDARPIRKQMPMGAGIITKFGWRTDSELGLTRNHITGTDENDPGFQNRIDRTEEGLRFRTRYLAFGRTRVLFEFARRIIGFDAPAIAALRDGDENRTLLGLDFGLGGRVSGTVRAGYSNFDIANPLATDFRGLVGDVALAYNFGDTGSRVTLVGARDVRYTLYENNNLYVYTGADLTLIKYFNRFLGMEVGGGRAILSFLGDPQNRRDNDTTGTVGVRFRISENQLGRRVEYAFRYTRWLINSTDPDLDQNRGTIGFGVSFGY